jgi:hypothetical protein
MPDLASDEPRFAFVYQEALRGLQQQQAAGESLHNRAGTLIFAASFASSLLGSRALTSGVAFWNWITIGLLLAIGALAVVILWSYYGLSFRADAGELLEHYVRCRRADEHGCPCGLGCPCGPATVPCSHGAPMAAASWQLEHQLLNEDLGTEYRPILQYNPNTGHMT